MGTITARYDASAERYRAWWEPVLGASALAILDRAGPEPADGGAARVLDVGTGAGLLAIEAVERWPTARVVGVDASTGMLGVAASQADARLRPADRGRLELVAADAARLPFPAAAFDLVVSSFVLQLVADRGAALREIHRVLRPGGRLATVTWLLGPDEPFEPDEAFEDALDAIGYDDDSEAEEARSGDFASATAAAAQFRRAGFRDVRADAHVLAHRHDRSTYVDFLEQYAESELFEDLEPDVRRRLRAETAARLDGLPEAAFEWRAPVVEVVARRP